MNPNFTKEKITVELVEAIKKQVQKYFEPEDMDHNCSICPAVGFHNEDPDCLSCPLGDGKSLDEPCTLEKTFIDRYDRRNADRKKQIARGRRLIEIAAEHGIKIEEPRGGGNKHRFYVEFLLTDFKRDLLKEAGFVKFESENGRELWRLDFLSAAGPIEFKDDQKIESWILRKIGPGQLAIAEKCWGACMD